jgi:plastocyanin
VDTGTALSRIPMWLLVLIVPVVAGIAILVTAPISGDIGTAPARSAAGADTVVIKNFAFSPNRLTGKAGQTITVVNDDSTAHTFTADRGAFNTGDLNGGQRGHVTVGQPGLYRYHCEIHPFMKAIVEISP